MGKVYAVASIKGGVGKTTIAGNLGVALARGGRKVLLIDTDLAMAGLTTVFGLSDAPVTLHDLLAGKGTVDKALCKAHGVDVLPSGPTVGGFLRADPTRLKGIIDGIKGGYDYVILDTPPGLSKYGLTPLKLADELLMIVMPEISSVESAARLENVAELLDAKITGVVVNRVRKPSLLGKLKGAPRMLRREEVQRRLRSKIIGGVPDDPSVVEAANLRRPVVLHKPKGAASKAFRSLAAILAGA